jgi:hypothetical protein
MNAHETVALIAAGGFAVIVAFQVALVLGAPFGAAAWGGATPGPLPANLRIASVVVGVVWASAALIVLSRAGIDVVSLPAEFARWGTWILVGLLSVGAVMNAASSSPWERYGWAPFSLVLAALCFVAARMPPTAPSA